jgi:hypothetical protein
MATKSINYTLIEQWENRDNYSALLRSNITLKFVVLTAVLIMI